MVILLRLNTASPEKKCLFHDGTNASASSIFGDHETPENHVFSRGFFLRVDASLVFISRLLTGPGQFNLHNRQTASKFNVRPTRDSSYINKLTNMAPL